jgi:hypothetical protein
LAIKIVAFAVTDVYTWNTSVALVIILVIAAAIAIAILVAIIRWLMDCLRGPQPLRRIATVSVGSTLVDAAQGPIDTAGVSFTCRRTHCADAHDGRSLMKLCNDRLTAVLCSPRSMDELREAVAALFEAALAIKSRMADCEETPSKSQLAALQGNVGHVQQNLNRLQTAMDALVGKDGARLAARFSPKEASG